MDKGYRILIAGTGGQGVLTAARLLSGLFLRQGREVVTGQLHGMAQRGGSVQASVMVDRGISPVIPKGGADVVLGLEPVETARALDLVSAGTKVFMNARPVYPYVLAQRRVLKQGNGAYPELETLVRSVTAVTKDVRIHDAARLAEEAGSLKTLSVVMLGWLLGTGELPATPEEFTEHVLGTAPPKVIEANRRAFLSGVELGRSQSKGRAGARA